MGDIGIQKESDQGIRVGQCEEDQSLMSPDPFR